MLRQQQVHAGCEEAELRSRIPNLARECRIAKGCAQEHFGITPALTTLGKIIGGGLPVGAYGGRRDIMKTVAPAGPMYQVLLMTSWKCALHTPAAASYCA